MKSAEIGKYIYSTRPIGKGSFSRVYKGLDTCNDSLVAIKVIDKHELKHDILERLHAEIDLMSTLHHPHILDVLDYLETESQFYMILEYCAGGDLAMLIKRGRVPEETSREYMCQLADALGYLQSKNIIHRDLKPHNILLSSDHTTIKVSDFNFAKEMYATDLASTLCGSPLYMAPEIIKKKDYSSKSDLWSIGIILYELVTGTNPFADAVHVLDLLDKIQTRRIPSVQYVSEECNALLSQLLQVDPDLRCDWGTFFSNTWLQQDEPIHASLDTEHMWESIRPSAPIYTSARNRANTIPEPIDNYIPTGITPPRHVQSEPIKIKARSVSTQTAIARSAPEHHTLTDNIWHAMTSSVGLIKGAVDYIHFR